ncbi:ATP synthase F0 subunit A [Marinilabiliaceae bacterium JC017]|nr:ATP synthase F0 subunit A [Marinilabiliaceae bacterium JC017]
MRVFILVIFVSFWGFTNFSVKASDKDVYGRNETEEFNPMDAIIDHISDSHYWHILSYTNKDGQLAEIAIPLPVIIYFRGRLSIFLSGEFNHGTRVVEKGGNYFVLYHDKVYVTGINGNLDLNEDGNPNNERPLDFSITKNVGSMWLSAFFLLWIFIYVARRYENHPSTPKGVQSLLEPIILFVRDDIAVAQIGENKARKFMPYLLTLFFFIWINNLIGLIPIFPGGSNLSGNISFTMMLALITFLITNINGSRNYWRHLFWTPGIPVWVRFFLIPVEFIGLFTKPFALMIRLFANITAGHIIILSLVSLIFVMKTIYIAPVSILLSLVMFMLELLVAVLQAYIFTLLSALFIGLAIQEEH